MADKTRRARSARARPGLILAAIGAATLLSSHLAAQAAYRIGPRSDWVQPVAVNVSTPSPSGQVTEGFEMLLIDRQEIVRPFAIERFRHVAYRLLDEGAVQAHSQIEIVFDSSYEQVTLHAATVIRNGRLIDQLRRSRIRVVQRESRLDYQIYDGSLSLVLLLEDVRRGDVVEYSYTRRGTNPVFAGHYMGAVSLEQAVPLQRVHFRLLWPRDRQLFVARHETGLEPSIHDAGPYREYVWDQARVPPKVLDADLPSWYDAFAELQLSDFASWSDVAAWGESLFASPGPVPAALRAPLARLRSASASTPARVLGALRFVQDEVRYLGVEIGVNSHVPYPPATVMKRRFGDCKDKALLLITMLHELGVAARPALVSTEYEAHIRGFHPTATVFDHAIVQATVDGRDYWLDPTALYERGDLPSVSPPFAAALVLDGPRDSLSVIPPPPDPGPLTDVAVSFDLGDVGTPATMRVDTRYRGAVADNQRASMRSTSIDELQHRYEDFYSARYPGIRSEAPPQVHDDESANEIRTIERYSVPDFWHRSRQQEGYVGTFEPLELTHAVPSATASRRTMPLAVTPSHIRYTIEAHIRQGWFITPREETIETPAVRFTYRSRSRGDTLRLAYEYETLADYVAPAAVAEHARKLSQINKLLVFSVTPPSAAAALGDWLKPGELNWPILLAALLATAAAAVFAARVYHAPAPSWPRRPPASRHDPSGLGGWLILVGVGVTVSPVLLGAGFLKTAPSYTASSWARLTTPGAANYHPLLAPILLFELVANLGLIVFAILQVSLFFRRKRMFLAVFVIFAAARVIIPAIDGLLINTIPALANRADAGPTVKWNVAFWALVWVWYVMRSKRVQNTFVN
ncbi:MAG TPA: DUF3857 domain-containing protein [Gemmatimonadales bacterium]|jgi:transglutaminase-like putative cysteine protease